MMGLRGESMNPMTFGNMIHPRTPPELMILDSMSEFVLITFFRFIFDS